LQPQHRRRRTEIVPQRRLGDTPDADAEHSLAGAEDAPIDLAYRPQIRR
jgi:hypothetical protein